MPRGDGVPRSARPPGRPPPRRPRPPGAHAARHPVRARRDGARLLVVHLARLGRWSRLRGGQRGGLAVGQRRRGPRRIPPAAQLRGPVRDPGDRGAGRWRRPGRPEPDPGYDARRSRRRALPGRGHPSRPRGRGPHRRTHAGPCRWGGPGVGDRGPGRRGVAGRAGGPGGHPAVDGRGPGPCGRGAGRLPWWCVRRLDGPPPGRRRPPGRRVPAAARPSPRRAVPPEPAGPRRPGPVRPGHPTDGHVRRRVDEPPRPRRAQRRARPPGVRGLSQPVAGHDPRHLLRQQLVGLVRCLVGPAARLPGRQHHPTGPAGRAAVPRDATDRRRPPVRGLLRGDRRPGPDRRGPLGEPCRGGARPVLPRPLRDGRSRPLDGLRGHVGPYRRHPRDPRFRRRRRERRRWRRRGLDRVAAHRARTGPRPRALVGGRHPRPDRRRPRRRGLRPAPGSLHPGLAGPRPWRGCRRRLPVQLPPRLLRALRQR